MSERLYVATRKGLFILQRAAKMRWDIGAPHFLGDPVTAVLRDARDGAIYAALNLGHFGVKLRRSRDGARTWEEIPAPAYPPQSGEDKTPWKLAQLWCLEAAGRDAPGVLWAGTIPGGLFRSGDCGASWSLNLPLWEKPERAEWTGGGYDHPGIHSVCIDPRSSERIAVAVSTGGVWQSRDGGASWSIASRGMRAEYVPPERALDPVMQDVHRMVQCPAKPEALWAQHHNGIFRSTDGSQQWQEITGRPSSFGFAVAVHPRDPDIAWFVPAVKDACRVPVDGALVVSRTRDGGRTFEVLGAGLPQEHAYDLVYRHALAVDATGSRLAMASTTGGLWISEDSGDSWRSLASRLPPVYAVRFED